VNLRLARPLQRPRSLLVDAWAQRRSRLLALVALTGLVGGAVGAAFLGALRLVADGIGPDRWSPVAHGAILVAVGVVVAVLTRVLGNPGNVELLVDNIHVSGGPDDIRSLRSLIPQALLCVGAGGPLGPEAPLVTATGSLASWLGLRSRLDRDDLRIVTITGMAAGFTVLFAAPLGAALFALEILHRRGLEYYEAILPAAIGSLCGYALSTLITGLGLAPMWAFPAPTRLRPADLAYGLAAGVVGAAIAAGFTYLTIGFRAVAGRLPTASQPVVGGAVLALLAVVTPYALTNGETDIDHLTDRRVVVATLLLAALGKLVASAVAMATGWRGGFIIPLFFAGFCLGRATEGHLPGGSSWALAAALMVAINVGVTKTPFGSTLVVTEMAGMTLLPTTLLAAIVSLALSSPLALIDSQRRRLGPAEDERERALDADGFDDDAGVGAGGRPVGAEDPGQAGRSPRPPSPEGDEELALP
jgi:H+/Cl- antiporter ClcA